jgi:hypothetical protein
MVIISRCHSGVNTTAHQPEPSTTVQAVLNSFSNISKFQKSSLILSFKSRGNSVLFGVIFFQYKL